MIDFPKNKKIILFDGICNLCNDSVLKVIKFDKKNNFVFAPLQSKTGQAITKHLKIDTSKIDSIILYEPGISYDIKSTAALKIMNDFGGFWFLSKLFWIFPETFRNLIYNYIAKNRYKWFGKKESCMIPTPELKAKFLD
ncbi:DCC1-like thiol-disulfide oxidoreductase family protein [Polaribacter sp. MSW13]|uniref:DCC1-like thiol-disulfide oxidoreductase family protein n=1 Tax=Polaribacter marinus TaxID=2916838 RepID=A0A9X1VLB0_9FLAO|nr:DCC1-like thiol-disulfide oxidoreductase family protein [Polaribacter marinus]MCI2228138.1 DCC1-like thiol-disulfide oxidoreductase family protein [Polaribacter marinus]